MDFLKIISVVVGVLAVVAFSSYGGAYISAQHGQPLMQLQSQPYITNTAQQPITTLKMGQAIVMHETVLRRSLDCYAMYVTSLKNKNDWVQLAPRYTSVLPTVDTVLDLPLHYDLPADMTPGEYEVRQMAFPTCEGFSTPAFDTGVHVKVTVTR